MLPTFLLIGAMKAGTTSLYRYLQAHPEVLMPALKEPDFFVAEKNWGRGLDWYSALFAAEEASPGAIGEASTNYSKYPAFQGVPGRIAAVLPNVKLVYMVRDPIERIRSHYAHAVHAGLETRTLGEAVASGRGSHYVAVTFYHLQLEQYLEHFSPEQILVIASEDLRHRRSETLSLVFQFVGVSADYRCADFELVHHRSDQKRRFTHLGRVLRLVPGHNRVLHRLPPLLAEAYRERTTSVVHKPDIPTAVREALTEVLRPEVYKLEALLGREFDWEL